MFGTENETWFPAEIFVPESGTTIIVRFYPTRVQVRLGESESTPIQVGLFGIPIRVGI